MYAIVIRLEVTNTTLNKTYKVIYHYFFSVIFSFTNFNYFLCQMKILSIMIVSFIFIIFIKFSNVDKSLSFVLIEKL